MRRVLCHLLVLTLLLPLAGCQSVPENAIPVLMYHNFVPEGEEVSGMTVTTERFREDMVWLINHGYTFVLPRDLAEGGPLPEKPVLVTVDDGYATSYYYLFPLLQELEVKAAVALIVSQVDQGSPDFLSWDMCREMNNSGLVEFGSHSYALHNNDERGGEYVEGTPNGIRHLDGESESDYADRVWSDLYHSIERIEEELGSEVCYFAYPFGLYDMSVGGFVHSNFAVTVTTNSGIATLDKGFFEMDRLTVTMEKSVQDYLPE